MADTVYTSGVALLAGSISSATVMAIQVTSSYTFNRAHDRLEDVSAFRVPGTSDATLTGVTFSAGILDAVDLSALAGQSGSTTAGVILYKFVTSEADSILILYATATGDGLYRGNLKLGTWRAPGSGGIVDTN